MESPKRVPHKVVFGKVDGENRGNNPMEYPITHIDDLFWLRDDERKDPEVIDWLKKERTHYDIKMEPLTDLSNNLYNEHLKYLQETDTSAPWKQDRYDYYSRTVKGSSYKIYCRILNNTSDTEEVILDVNKLAIGKSHCEVGNLDMSPNHEILAYTLDTDGNEQYNLIYTDNNKEYILIGNICADFEWSDDSNRLFYIVKDKCDRPYQVKMHTIGEKQSNDIVLYEEFDELFTVDVSKIHKSDIILINIQSSETSYVYMFDTQINELSLVRKKKFGVRYHVAEISERNFLYIITNDNGCTNNKLVTSQMNDPSKWEDIVIPSETDVQINDFELFKNYGIISGRRNGCSQLWKVPYSDDIKNIVPNDIVLIKITNSNIYDIDTYINYDKNTNIVRIHYSDPLIPPSWVDYDLMSGKCNLVKQTKIPGYDRDQYVCKRIYAIVRDGTKVGMNIVHRKDIDLTKTNPVVINGYGSYGICMDAKFNKSLLPILDKGVISVVALIRGGGEYGHQWYEKQGKYLNKMNTFTDFIDCIKHLININMTTPKQVAICGRSAGGLLIGATINMAPELINVAVAGVPFVDVLTTMCDPSIPLTIQEWEEWGNPNEQEYYDYMKLYSPMDNVEIRAYPNVYLSAGLNDMRVGYWEPAKFAIKLRKNNIANTDILFKIDIACGHFSASDRYRYIKEQSEEQAYIISKICNLATNTNRKRSRDFDSDCDSDSELVRQDTVIVDVEYDDFY